MKTRQSCSGSGPKAIPGARSSAEHRPRFAFLRPRNPSLAVPLLFFVATTQAQVPTQYVDALPKAQYSVYTAHINSDGILDLLVKAKPKFAPISVDDIVVPIPVKPSSPTFVLLSSGNSYVLDAAPGSATIGGAWQPASFQLFYGDFAGNGTAGMLLRSLTGGVASITVTTSVSNGAPQLVQALTSASVGVDLGDANVTTELRDQNNDGRADLLVRRSGLVTAVLLADSNGVFTASDANSVQAAWFGMLAALSNGDSTSAAQYIDPAIRDLYVQAFSNMGSAATGLQATLSNLAPVHIDSTTASFVVDQNTSGVSRMHLLQFAYRGGRWMLASF